MTIMINEKQIILFTSEESPEQLLILLDAHYPPDAAFEIARQHLSGALHSHFVAADSGLGIFNMQSRQPFLSRPARLPDVQMTPVMPAGKPGVEVIAFSVPTGVFSPIQQELIQTLAIQTTKLFLGYTFAPDQYTRDGQLVISDRDERGRPTKITITLRLDLLYNDEGGQQ